MGAGAVQALAGAPADNVRALMEQGAFHPEKSVSGWRHAWKEVFIRSSESAQASAAAAAEHMPSASNSRLKNVRDMREIRSWVGEVRSMAGRGELPLVHVCPRADFDYRHDTGPCA